MEVVWYNIGYLDMKESGFRGRREEDRNVLQELWCKNIRGRKFLQQLRDSSKRGACSRRIPE